MELRERLQDESPLVQARVWNLEAGLVELGLPGEKEVEIEGARALRGDRLAAAAEPLLDPEEQGEQLARGQGRVDCNDAVHEARLVEEADRIRLDQGRDAGDLYTVFRTQRFDGVAEGSRPVAEVRAKGYVRA